MIKRVALSVMMVAMASGCATTTVGRTADMSNVSQLEVGVTTIAEAERLLGRPTHVTRTNDGTVVSYVRTQVRSRNMLGTSADVDSEVFTLIFGADGRLMRYGDSRQNVPVN